MQEIYCPLRKKLLAARPEEMIRIKLFHYLMEKKGFPASSFVIEASLSSLPHLQEKSVDLNRRLDAVVYSPQFVKPLLLIECKAVKSNSHAIRQLMGYNVWIDAYFVLLVDPFELKLFAKDPEIQSKIAGDLPDFKALEDFLKRFPAP